MMWSYTFDDIAMDYIGDLCCREFRPQELCAYELTKLKEYDAANGTELYKTLVLYILNKRNTVATSSELYVGRSTLFYRLRKIKEITGLDAAHMAEPCRTYISDSSVFLQKEWMIDRREEFSMLTPKQNLLETLKKDGKPECLCNSFTMLRGFWEIPALS